MTAIRKFIPLPLPIEAMQWDGTYRGAKPIVQWVEDNCGDASYYNTPLYPPMIHIGSHNDSVRAFDGDWVIQGPTGMFDVCKPAIFDATYYEENQR